MSAATAGHAGTPQLKQFLMVNIKTEFPRGISDQVISSEAGDGERERASWSGPTASSFKHQAPGTSSDKRQAPSTKVQAPSRKQQAPGSGLLRKVSSTLNQGPRPR